MIAPALAVLALPFAAFVVLALVPPLRRSGRGAGLCSIAAIGAAFVLAVVQLSGGRREALWSWIPADGGPMATVGLLVDELSATMLVLITLVSLLVQVYSLSYLHDEPAPALGRYYTYQSLFAFSMLGLVLAPTFVQMFVFWELVGLASYLLIGFWFAKQSAGDASKKALISNRVGDFGFMLGILCVWALAGTVDFAELSSKWAGVDAAPALLLLAGLLVFCGAVGKSAQLPLHIWLPDAMEGPTPVSALIHAATMVAAGVYMLYRTSFLWEVSTDAGDVVA